MRLQESETVFTFLTRNAYENRQINKIRNAVREKILHGTSFSLDKLLCKNESSENKTVAVKEKKARGEYTEAHAA